MIRCVVTLDNPVGWLSIPASKYLHLIDWGDLKTRRRYDTLTSLMYIDVLLRQASGYHHWHIDPHSPECGKWHSLEWQPLGKPIPHSSWWLNDVKVLHDTHCVFELSEYIVCDCFHNLLISPHEFVWLSAPPRVLYLPESNPSWSKAWPRSAMLAQH